MRGKRHGRADRAELARDGSPDRADERLGSARDSTKKALHGPVACGGKRQPGVGDRDTMGRLGGSDGEPIS